MGWGWTRFFGLAPPIDLTLHSLLLHTHKITVLKVTYEHTLSSGSLLSMNFFANNIYEGCEEEDIWLSKGGLQSVTNLLAASIYHGCLCHHLGPQFMCPGEVEDGALHREQTCATRPRSCVHLRRSGMSRCNLSLSLVYGGPPREGDEVQIRTYVLGDNGIADSTFSFLLHGTCIRLEGWTLYVLH
jgi:hypothetical protein